MTIIYNNVFLYTETKATIAARKTGAPFGLNLPNAKSYQGSIAEFSCNDMQTYSNVELKNM